MSIAPVAFGIVLALFAMRIVWIVAMRRQERQMELVRAAFGCRLQAVDAELNSARRQIVLLQSQLAASRERERTAARSLRALSVPAWADTSTGIFHPSQPKHEACA